MLPTRVVVLMFSICTSFPSISNSLNLSKRFSSHSLPTKLLIEKYGYPAEVHPVETKDGYILEMHRIPFSAKSLATNRKPVVFLQHGIFDSSSQWVIMGPNKALGFILADQNYDVWLGNSRGNTYSRKHVTLDPDVNTSQFWNFSFHEMGIFDIPAEIDYILNETQQQKVFYIGYSQGTTQFYVLVSEKPEYNMKFRAMISLAPVAFFSSDKHQAIVNLLLGSFEALKYLPYREILSHSATFKMLGTMCSYAASVYDICTSVVAYKIRELGANYLDESVVPEIIGHTPGGSSSKALLHYLQEVRSAKFRKYDCGKEENLKMYGRITPPDYNLSKITVPVSLHYGGSEDIFVQPKDVKLLYNKLPNPIGLFQVAADYNHLDYLFGRNVKPLLYDHIIELMAKF